jgi:hypothetical protein
MSTTTALLTTPPTTLLEGSVRTATEPPELDRSVLSLGLVPGDTRPGRFLLVPGPSSDFLMSVQGRYWVGGEGDVYTALDIDPELIAAQMALLAADIDSMGGQPDDSPYLTSLRNHYRGDEFQIGLTDLVRFLGVGGLPVEWAEQWSWFVQADGTPVPADLEACREALESLDRAGRTWVRDVRTDFVDGAWAFPLDAFEGALASEIEAASVCELFVEGSAASPEIVIVLANASEKQRIEVLVDEGIYTDQEPERMLAITMWPDESVGPPPSEPNPASLLTVRGSYLTAIGVCGELPWIYSNFAAADTYHAPGSGGYDGPVVFASGWHCEDDVPETRRDDGG